MEPDRRFSRSWWLGFVALVLVVPAALVFVDRDLIDRSTPISMEEAEHPILFPDVGPDGVVQVGPGACSVESDEVIVTGRGMTSCRKTEWLMAAHRDYTVVLGFGASMPAPRPCSDFESPVAVGLKFRSVELPSCSVRVEAGPGRCWG